MPTAGTPQSAEPNRKGSQVRVPFLVGSNRYAEKIFTDTHEVQSGEAREFVHNITPGGFLRGVTLYVRSESGSLGQGSLLPDNPWSLLSNITLENIDGSPIKYPMSGYAYYLENKYGKPWFGDPSKYDDFRSGINPSFQLRVFPEIKNTAGTLANTDARSQYRVKYTVGGGNNALATGNVGAWPKLTITGYMESWSQTDQQDLHGNPIEPLPAGLSVGSLLRHEIKTLNAAGADNVLQLTNTGNEFRCLILVTRNGKGEREDLLTDPVRFRVDDRSMFVRSPDSIFSQMTGHYEALRLGITEREKGVYVLPRFRQPDGQGEYWLATSNATYVTFESATASTAKNMPGTLEVISDEVVPIQAVPGELEGI